MAYTRFGFRDEEERIEFLIALPILALFGIMLYHFVFAGDSDTDLNPGVTVAAAMGGDIDSDGVIDAEDHCTAVAGSAANFGCPANQKVVADNAGRAMDSDGDGVTDAVDRCPEDAGLVPDFGCPATAEAEQEKSAEKQQDTIEETTAEMPADADGDGIADDTDQCPQQAGSTANGCPDPVVVPEPAPVPAVDTDSDGVFDADDSCPQQVGTPENEGCPLDNDSDGDGVEDADDLCPQSSGVAENRGCPADSDADGLPDNQDQCPDRQGPIDSGGCPVDSDGDGVEDSVDECVDVAGDDDNAGCPLEDEVDSNVDGDGDGVPDANDACPSEAGKGSVDGCPATQQTALESLGADISFETASATLTSESKELLDVVASILQKYPAVKLLVEGHTDNQGQAPINLRLSEQRARACTTYLARQGVAEERMRAVGYGDTKPLVPNDSEAARKRNRRVEFKLTN